MAMNKRGQIEKMIGIILIILVLLAVAWIFIRPLLAQGAGLANDTTDVICQFTDLGNCDEGTMIVYFSGEGGLDGTLWLRYQFMNDPEIHSYLLRQSNINSGEAASRFSGEADLKRDSISSAQNKEGYSYQIIEIDNNEGEIVPAALAPKNFRLFALDEDGGALEKMPLEYLGVFPGIFYDDKTRYDESIESFIALAEELKSGLDLSSQLILHEELVLVGFSKEFNDGKGGYIDTGLCKKKDIIMPKECAEAQSCLCLCLREDMCGNGGRLCYGYEEDFIGGSYRNCGVGRIFSKKGDEAELGRPIEIWQEEEFKDKEDQFNSLFIVNEEEEGSSRIGLIVRRDAKRMEDYGLSGTVKRMIISKV